MRKTSGAFTLVELLVVIGIIALLISVLLPSLSKARDAAAKTQCLSNVRQITTAIVMYTSANRGYFPAQAASTGEQANDWVKWRKDASGNLSPDIGTIGIGRYLSLSPSSVAVLRCQGDMEAFSRSYTFSYAVNWQYHSNDRNAPAVLQQQPTAPNTRQKITMVRQSSEKILVIEEDERTIDDGNCAPCPRKLDDIELTDNGSRINLLGLRHDRAFRNKPEDYNPPFIPNSKGSGVVGFIDGHAGVVSRRVANSYEASVADAAADGVTWKGVSVGSGTFQTSLSAAYNRTLFR